MKKTMTKLKMISSGAGQIYLPSTISTDSTFPFERVDQDLIIKIVGEKLVVEKADNFQRADEIEDKEAEEVLGKEESDRINQIIEEKSGK